MKRLLFTLALYCLLPGAGATIISIPADFLQIQSGINNAAHGDTVLVSPGIYVENLNFNGKNIVVASFFLLTGDDVFISQTVINGNSDGPTIILENAENNAAIIGFTITGGSADSLYEYAGAVLCKNTSPLIKRNIISNNMGISAANGAGIVCVNSYAIIIDNTLDSNSFHFSEFTAGIICIGGSPVISYNKISNTWGGYVHNAGGGIVVENSSPAISYNLIRHNYNFDNKSGGIYLDKSNAEIRNNTIVNNYKGITMKDSCNINAINNILYFQYSDPVYQINTGNIINADYNNIEGGFPGFSIMDLDPQFSDTTNFDYTLTSTSPCIDAGDPLSLPDPDGTTADLGAFYFDQLTNINVNNDNYNVVAFPNPVKEELTIIGIKMNDGYIANSSGQVIMELKEQGNKINVSKLSSGIYFITLYGDTFNYTFRIIKL